VFVFAKFFRLSRVCSSAVLYTLIFDARALFIRSGTTLNYILNIMISIKKIILFSLLFF
jgi:hypothetical protein